MKVLFMRHGESMSQAGRVTNSDPDAMNILTEHGVAGVCDAATALKTKIDAVYSSPFARTQLTAAIFLLARDEKTKITVDNRLREIDYGFHGGDTKRHPEMVAVSIKQVNGDYDVRFGRTGENKREIVTRFFEFLTDVFSSHGAAENILAVTHGRAISIIHSEYCAINNIAYQHGGTKNAQIVEIELCAKKIEKIKSHIQKINQTKTKGV